MSKSKAWGHRCQLEFLNDNKTMQWLRGINRGCWILRFRERMTSFSIDSRLIRSSEFFGTRRKVALRIEAYAWAPILGFFDKLHDVGVSSCLSYS